MAGESEENDKIKSKLNHLNENVGKILKRSRLELFQARSEEEALVREYFFHYLCFKS